MANITHKIFTSRVNGLDTTTYVGEAGRLFYAQTTGTGWAPTLRYSDGSTVGGLPISGSSISVSGAPPAHPLEGNLWYDNEDGRLYVYYGDTWVDASPDTGYTLPVASTSTLGGVKADGVTLVVNTYTGVASVVFPYDNDSEYATHDYVDIAINTVTSTLHPDRITSGTNSVYVTEDGKLNLASGSILFYTTSTPVVNLVDVTINSILEYSTTVTDYISTGTYGNISPITAPFTVIQLATTPPIPLFTGDIIGSGGFPVPSTVIYAGTGTYTTVLILDSDFSVLPAPLSYLPETGTIARPLTNPSLTVQTDPGVDLALNPGGENNVIIHNDLVPVDDFSSNLGSAGKRFRHLWLGQGTIYIKDEITGADQALTARDGLFTILGGAGLSVGEFEFTDNQIKIKDNARDIIVGTTVATGYVQFNRPIKVADSQGNRTFEVDRDGRVSILSTATIQTTQAALEITGSPSGNTQIRNFSGTMIQVTGQQDIATRATFDSFGTTTSTVGGNAYSVIAARAARGTVDSPEPLQAGDVILRFSNQGWTNGGSYASGIARLSFEALEGFTPNNQGTLARIQLTPMGSNQIRDVVTFTTTNITLANGVGIKFLADGSRQTTAWTGTVAVSQISNLGSGAVTSITINPDGLSGVSGPGTATINNTGVIGISGTPDQIYINTMGRTTETSGHFTLLLPQNISPTSNVTFNDVNINGNLNLLSTATILIPNTIEGTLLLLGSTVTTTSTLAGGGIILGNSSTAIASILWNLDNNYWDFDGAGIHTQNLETTTATINTDLIVKGQAHFGDSFVIGDYSNATVQVDSLVPDFSQIVFQNHSSSTFASTDFVATNDIGTDASHYIDMGINSNLYYDPLTWAINGGNDGYLYVDGGNLALGTTASNIVFFTGDVSDINSIQATISNTGLNVVSTVTAAGFHGALVGNVTGDVTGNVTGRAGYVQYALSAGSGLSASTSTAYNGH